MEQDFQDTELNNVTEEARLSSHNFTKMPSQQDDNNIIRYDTVVHNCQCTEINILKY